MRVHRALVTATTALALTAAPAAATATPDEADRTGLDRTGLQDRLDDVVAAGAVGALAEVRDEHGLWRGTSGVAELGRTRAVPVHGRFRAGSITKTFVATVALQLVGEGRLRLNAPVEAWLPGVVPHGHRIAVRHLLNHTSGLHDYLGTLPMPPEQEFLDNRWRTWTAAELVQRAVANPADVRTAGVGLRVLEHQLPPARADHREGDRAAVRRGDRAPGHPTVAVARHLGAGDFATDSRAASARLRADTARRRDAPPRLHGDESVGDGRKWRDDLDDPGSQPVLRRTARWTPAAPSPARRNEDAGCRGRQVRARAGLVAGHVVRCPCVRQRRRCTGVPDLVVLHGGRSHQVTVALTPDFRSDPDDAVDAFLDKAVCG